MFNKFFATPVIILVFFLCVFSKNVYAESQNSDIILIYGEHEDFDRFVLEYKEKPEYSIISDNYITYIKLPKHINITSDTSLGKYPRKSLLTQNNIDDVTLIAIPSPIVKNFEYEENKIVVDVISYKDIKGEQADVIIKTESRQIDESKTLSFPWDKEVGLAAFERNGNLWLIFDNSSEPDLSNVDTQSSEFISNILQIPSTKITALIITTKGNFDFSTSKDGFNWNVTLSKKSKEKFSKTLTASIEENTNGAFLYIPTKSVKNVITMLDPYTGEILMVAPVIEPNLGFEAPYKYVDLKFLTTHQGVALEAFADNLIIKKETDGLIIEGVDRGLNISSNLEKLKKETK